MNHMSTRKAATNNIEKSKLEQTQVQKIWQ